MAEVRDREVKLALEKKNKVSSHIQSINQFVNIQDQLDNLSDLEVLSVSKNTDDTLKLVTKNAVDYTFTLSVLPEMKKDIEITNFGKQLKNALRDQESTNQSKSAKLKNKQGKKTGKPNISKPLKQKSDPKDSTENDTIEIPAKNSSINLNESNITEISTPVCISAKTHFFNPPQSKPLPEANPKPSAEVRPVFEVKSNPVFEFKPAEEVKPKPTSRQNTDLPPQPKTITTQVLNRNPKTQSKPASSSDKPSSSFSYQPSKGMDKINLQGSQENMFNQLLESTQLRQRDRIKRKKNMLTKVPGTDSSKDLTVTEEDKEEDKEAKPEVTSTYVNSAAGDSESGPVRDNDRSHRSYLRHTKTSRMKSVNRRDDNIKERIKNETMTKFENHNFKRSKEGLPPTSAQNGATTPSSILMNHFKKLSPRMKGLDEPIKGTHNHSTDAFRLEGKAREFDNRKGSRTNREGSETFEGRFNFSKLDERRAAHKNLKAPQSISNIPTAKNFDKKNQDREQRFNTWERKFNNDLPTKNQNIHKEIEDDDLLSNICEDVENKGFQKIKDSKMQKI